MTSTPEERLNRLIRHARKGWLRAREDARANERARDWIREHPSRLPEVDELWLACLNGDGPLADWLATDAPPESWTHDMALHTVLACHPFADLQQWSIQKT